MIPARKTAFHESGTEKTISLANDPRSSEPAFVVHVSNRKLELWSDEFLEICWTNGFDTPCSICDLQFDVAKAPPVRTIRLNRDLRDVSPFTKILPPLIISNNHLECLKHSHIRYFPVSHAWHQPIAEAYASRVSNPVAAKMAFEIPARILLAAVQRFGPDVQIWHDYISIPQWQDSFRGTTILPQIFQIFQFGESSIIHLDEEPAIQTLETYTLEHFIAQSSSLQRLFSARWFSRMWIVIEYEVCKDAFLLNSSFEIMPGTFSSLMRQISECHTSCLNDNLIHSTSVGSALRWIETVPMFVKERIKNKCLGYVYDIIGNQGCRSHRDRFIASCVLLDVDNYSRILLELPQDPQKACLWVSKRCLEGNDFSPLLLHPSTEEQYEKAHWLRGHTLMTSSMWGWAIQTRPAHVALHFQGNRVFLELDLVGKVMRASSWRTGGIENHFGFVEVLPHIVELAAGSVSRFLNHLERIFPSEFFWVQRENSYDFPGIRYQSPPLLLLKKRLQVLLEQYSDANCKGNSARCNILCDEIVLVVKLSEPPSLGFGSFRTVGRLQLYSLICAPTEYTLLSVQCETCSRITPFRVTLWQEPNSEARLYRIPGLAYRDSVPEGIGVVVENEHIIGRMRFGFSACNCSPRTLIQLS